MTDNTERLDAVARALILEKFRHVWPGTSWEELLDRYGDDLMQKHMIDKLGEARQFLVAYDAVQRFPPKKLR